MPLHVSDSRHTPTRRRRRTSRIGVTLVVGALAATCLTSVAAVQAATASQDRSFKLGQTPGGARTAAGGPRPAQSPTILFSEGFENGTGTAPIGLQAYTGASGEKYSADAPWLDVNQCNGLITSQATTSTGSCVDGNGSREIRSIGNVLGQVQGTDPSTNHSVAAWTTGAPGADLIEFETANPIPISTSKRFVTFSVDAAAVTCNAAHPQLRFYLVDGETEMPTSPKAIDPCSDPAAKTYTVGSEGGYRAGSFVSNGATLFSGSEFGIRMRNEQGSGAGNDHGFDDIKVLDATPVLDTDFAPGKYVAGDVVPMTFTVTNTSEQGAKPGWSFDEKLPVGLRVADTPNTATTCDAGAVTATGDAIHGAGNLKAGDASCTMTVDVTSDKGGSFTTDGTTTTDLTGLDAPQASTVVFDAASPVLTLHETAKVTDANHDGLVDAGDTVLYSSTVKNDGNVALRSVSVKGDRSGTSTCAPVDLPVGTTAACASTAPHTITQAEVASGSAVETASATGTYLGGQTATSGTAVVTTKTVAPVATLSATETAAITNLSRAGQAPKVGDEILYQTTVTNTGNVLLTSLSGTSAVVGDLTPAAASIAPGAGTTLTGAKHVVTQADIDAGSLTDTVAVASTGPDGQKATGTASVKTDMVAAKGDLGVTERVVDGAGHDVSAPKAGDEVSYQVLVVNKGNVTLKGVTVSSDRVGALTSDTADLAPGAQAVFAGGVYTVTQGDVDAGTFADSAASTAKDARGATVTGKAGVTTPTVAAVPSLSTSIAISDSRGEPVAAPGLGERVSATTTVVNTGNVTLHDVSAKASVAGLTCGVATLAPGAKTVCKGDDHTVTQADVDRGSFAQHADVSALDPRGVKVTGATGATTATAAELAQATIVESASIGGATPAADAKAGDEVAVQAVVTNTGNVTLTGIVTTSDATGEMECAVGSLAPGESTDCAGAKTIPVLQADVDSGEGVSDAASLSATSARGTAVTAGPAHVVVPLAVAEPSILLHETTDFDDANHDGKAQIGERIAFGYRVENTGNVVVHLPEIESTLNGRAECSVIEILPAATISCGEPLAHLVTQEDVTRGEIADTSVAKGFVSRGATDDPTAGGGADDADSPRAVPSAPRAPGVLPGGHDVTKLVAERRIPLESKAVEYRIAVEAIPEPVILAFTGSTGLPVLGGTALFLALAGGLVIFWRRRREAEGEIGYDF